MNESHFFHVKHKLPSDKQYLELDRPPNHINDNHLVQKHLHPPTVRMMIVQLLFMVYYIVFSYTCAHSNSNIPETRRLFRTIPLTIFVPSSIPTTQPSEKSLLYEDHYRYPSSSPTTSMQPTYYVTPWGPSDNENGGDNDVVVIPPSIHSLPDSPIEYDNEGSLSLGYMCDIIPRAYMEISSSFKLFEIDIPLIYIDPTIAAEVTLYMRPNTHEGYERRPNAWTFVKSEQFLGSNISTTEAEIVHFTYFDPISLSDSFGEIAIYLHCSNNCMILTSNIGETGELFVEDENIMMLVGTAKNGEIAFQNSSTGYVLGDGGKIRYMLTSANNGVENNVTPTSSPITMGSIIPSLVSSSTPSESSSNPIIETPDSQTKTVLQSGNYIGSKRSAGTMFTIASTSNQSQYIRGLNIHTDATSNLRLLIYFRNGNYDNYLRRPNAWSLAFDGIVLGMGEGMATVVPQLDIPILVEPSQSVSFYITTEANNNYNIISGDGYSEGDIFASDSNIDIKVGVGKGGRRLFANTYSDFAFEGALHYENVLLNAASNISSGAFYSTTYSLRNVTIISITLQILWSL